MRLQTVFSIFLQLFGAVAFAASPSPSDSSPEFENLDPVELVSEIDRADDFFQWYELRESVFRRNLDDPKIADALRRTEKRLRENNPPVRIQENLELLGFRWWIHDMKTAELARYRANWLFHLTEKTQLAEGESLRLILNATPNTDHAHLLLYPIEREHGMLQGTARFDPPLSEWPADSYHLVMTPFAAPLVPFRMETFLLRKKGDRILGQWGRRIDLGWYVDFPE